ncbi:MAG: hypothetical protein IKQ07_03855 [Bacteroidaceae bacterium]|nr:hypothetical protein [Bacteroidaceae bacterium]
MRKNSSTIKTVVLATMAALLCSSTIQAKVVSEDLAASIAGQLMSVKGKKLSKSVWRKQEWKTSPPCLITSLQAMTAGALSS